MFHNMIAILAKSQCSNYRQPSILMQFWLCKAFFCTLNGFTVLLLATISEGCMDFTARYMSSHRGACSQQGCTVCNC